MKDQLSDLNERLHRRLPVLWAFIVQRFKRGERYGLDFTLAFIAILVTMWIFIAIIETAVTETELYYLDRQIQVFMTGLLSPALAESFVVITNLGGTRGTVIGILIVGIPLLLTRRWWSLFGLIFTTAGGGLLIWGLKLFFHRARPTESAIEVGGFAFPSGHAFAAMAFFGYVLYLAYRHFRHDVIRIAATIFCFVMILLIGSSRVFLNVHWLTDVAGGYLAGFAWLILSIIIVRHVEWPHRKAPKKTEAAADGEPQILHDLHRKTGADISKRNPSV